MPEVSRAPLGPSAGAAVTDPEYRVMLPPCRRFANHEHASRRCSDCRVDPVDQPLVGQLVHDTLPIYWSRLRARRALLGGTQTECKRFRTDAVRDHSRSRTSTDRMVGRCRAISCQLSPSSVLANIEPLFVPK